MSGRSLTPGYLAVLCAVIIWGAWVAFTRLAVIGNLTPASVALLRTAVPAIILAPFVFRAGFWPKGRTLPFLFCILGAGAPFLLIVGHGMRYAQTADVGSLVPGTMPLLVALLSVLLFREKLGWTRTLGFALCAAGVAAIGGRSILAAAGDATFGHMLLLAGALFWACYGIAFRFVGLSAIQMVALVSFWSGLVLLPAGLPPLIHAASNGAHYEVLVQVAIQGIGSGVIAYILFNIGIERLGASRAAAFVALVPALATLIAIPLLNEVPDAPAIFGVVATGFGVLLASGVVNEFLSKRAAG